ncbi:MAG: kinase [Oscillospiraceae bacterium]|nr:kinase [Oscillospiraceae bacterium]
MADEQQVQNTAVTAKKPKKEKKEKKKKEKRIPNHGISGVGEDYTYYFMNSKEKMIGLLAGLVVGFFAAYLYFNSAILGVIVGLIAGIKGVDIYRGSLQRKRKRELLVQFRDMLESLSNSLTVGATSSGAFHSAYRDMITEHGEKAYITKELQLICAMYDNQGTDITTSLTDFAQRSGIEDVASFASVFDVSTELGGDIAKVVRDSRDMIGDKIEIELEIQTMITAKRNELNILAVMPIAMSLLTKSFSDGKADALTIGVRIIALGLFIASYAMGTKIVDIKV